MKEFVPRPYQQECLDAIKEKGSGRYLCKLATGLGKTAIFTHVPRHGRMLILSHREELVHQPLAWYEGTDTITGVEQASEHASASADVVSASVQTMVRRKKKYPSDWFDTIIVDEAHHAAAKTYRAILDYFKPRALLGFTATPNRSDRVRLNDVFDEIIFDRDLLWGIKSGWLSDIECKRIDIGYDLRGVHTRQGDYAPGELAEAMDGTADAIAEAYRTLAKGATLIFAVNVHQCEEIAKRIPGAAVVTGSTKNRGDIIERFTAGEIPCIVNCMVFSEGTDIPRVETVIIARPTQSDTLYTQMVGRGLRLYPGKERLLLVDCVGVTGKASLCTAPSLLGISLADIPERRLKEVEGLLFELPAKVEAAADCPQSWVRNVETVDIWAKGQKYNLHNINWFRMPDGALVCSLKDGKRITIPPADELGMVRGVPMQVWLDSAYSQLETGYEDQRYIWDLEKAKGWGRKPATDKQVQLIERLCKRRHFDVPENMNKLEASQVLNRLMNWR